VAPETVKTRFEKYMDPNEYYRLRENIYADFNYMHTNDMGCIEFSGRYPQKHPGGDQQSTPSWRG